VRTSTSQVLGTVTRLATTSGRPSLPELAATAQRSPWSFHRLFGHVTGEPPARFARRVALDRAAARLLTDDMMVIDVAIDAGKDDGMTANIELRDFDGFTALVIRRRIARDAIAETLAECLPRVFEHAQRNGLTLASPPFARYPEVSLGGFVIECGLAIAEPAEALPPADGLDVIEVAPCRAATATHHGTYDTLPATYAAIERWLQTHGMAPGDAAWETYVTDPGEHPDPADRMTQVVQPVVS